MAAAAFSVVVKGEEVAGHLEGIHLLKEENDQKVEEVGGFP